MSELLGILSLIVVISALGSAIATPFIVLHVARKIAGRLEAVEHEIAQLDWDLNGPDDPDEGEPNIKPSNVVAIGKRAA